MKTILLIIFFFVISGEAYSQRVAVRDFASKKVYITENTFEADMLVYVTTESWKVKPGVWYYVNNNPDDGWSIQFTESKSIADLIIKFVNNSVQAGWTDKGKKKLELN